MIEEYLHYIIARHSQVRANLKTGLNVTWSWPFQLDKIAMTFRVQEI